MRSGLWRRFDLYFEFSLGFLVEYMRVASSPDSVVGCLENESFDFLSVSAM